MAKLVFGMNVSLDGYVDHDKFAPGETLFRHWIEQVRSLTGSVYGRRLYEIMSYFDQDDPAWDGPRREFADAWRKQKKWVVSRTLTSVGPNATLISIDDVHKLKAEQPGELSVGGPELAHGVMDLIDEYRLYYRPVVLGGGTPFFFGPRPLLRPIAHERIGEDAVRLTYVPAERA